MKIRIALVMAALLTSASSIGEDTFESVQAEFRRGVAALLPAEGAPIADLSANVAELAEGTFGAHPELVREEAERRFRALPSFAEADLGGWIEHASWDLSGMPALAAGEAWALFTWDPERLTSWAKSALLARELGTEEFGRRAFLNAFSPDELYRLGAGAFPMLVVESLGELFVIELEPAAEGVCWPTAIRWLKQK